MDLMQGGSSKIRTAARPTHDGTHIADDAVPGLEKRSQECPPQYCIATIFKDASLDVVRDFFWDDDFLVKNTWDNICSTRLNDGCTKTGTMVVCWVRKFPFFCNDREYVIGRRVWASGKTYYCANKVFYEMSSVRKYLSSK
ncbi:hypothetical protein CFC21_041472 [Triticum aestivum]|uniref:Uncharacterized protein n=2 Tax=Triticum aestivum TaxID=4565 RepID=A0A3B6FQN1_WHEAT|nr:hypothetical protein CFC21_041472 [Triticum aestivum]